MDNRNDSDEQNWYDRQPFRAIIYLLIGTLAIYGALTLTDKAFGAEPPASADAASVSVDPGRPKTQEPTCGSGNELECAREWSRKKARQFRKGNLGSSRGLRFPRWFRAKADRAVARAQGVSYRSVVDDDHWWDFPANAMRCLAYWNTYGDCSRANEIRDRVTKDATRVFVGCGTSSIIAAFTFKKSGILKKGWLGAGAGTLACVWHDIYNSFW